ncbi:MAG TPA: SDR family NAD(P)-dependent oxidoreductase [Pseudonocardiaceae bacterium]|nr:SDR family NAD(P)-dependent oxidoreductase [Pseudonocardiaceae bacterium]
MGVHVDQPWHDPAAVGQHVGGRRRIKEQPVAVDHESAFFPIRQHNSAYLKHHNPPAADRARLYYPGRNLAVRLDIADTARIPAVVEEVIGRYGRIDVLVNSAGRALVGGVEATTDAVIWVRVGTCSERSSH